MTIGSGATVQHGNSPGTLTINGTFSSSGNMLFEIGGLRSGQYDVLQINGNANFTGGNVEFDFTHGFNASANDYWNFVFADNITGWNSLSVEVNGLGNGLGWEIEPETLPDGYVEEELLITAQNGGGTSVPEPSTMLLLCSGLAGLAAYKKRFNKA